MVVVGPQIPRSSAASVLLCRGINILLLDAILHLPLNHDTPRPRRRRRRRCCPPPTRPSAPLYSQWARPCLRPSPHASCTVSAISSQSSFSSYVASHLSFPVCSRLTTIAGHFTLHSQFLAGRELHLARRRLAQRRSCKTRKAPRRRLHLRPHRPPLRAPWK